MKDDLLFLGEQLRDLAVAADATAIRADTIGLALISLARMLAKSGLLTSAMVDEEEGRIRQDPLLADDHRMIEGATAILESFRRATQE